MWRLLPLLLLAGCAGLASTEAQKQVGGVLTDQAEVFNEKGAVAGSPSTEQHLRNAQTNEVVLGSPKERLAVADLAAQEEVRATAEAQASDEGWKKIARGTLGAISLGLGLFGIPVGGLIDKVKAKLIPKTV